MTKTMAALALSVMLTSHASAEAVPASDDLAPLSTDFSSPADLSDWSEHTPEGFNPKWAAPRVKDGKLVLQPKSSGWFEDMQAGHLYREIEGDFIFTADMDVRGTGSDVPQTEFSLAGIFIRAPRDVSAANWIAGEENWIFFSVGTASPAGSAQYEVKSTYNSISTLKIFPTTAAPVQLRIARQGELFTLLHKPQGSADWSVIDQIIRPDLPGTLNVGLTAYADFGSIAPIYPDYFRYNTEGAPTQNADLIAYVDRVSFRRPATGRFPIANLDAPAAFGADLIAARLADLTAD